MKFADTFDTSTDGVAGLHRSDAGGRSVEDEIARREVYRLRGTLITSGTDQIRSRRSPRCLISPFTDSQISPATGCPISDTECKGLQGAEASKLLAQSQGRLSFFASS